MRRILKSVTRKGIESKLDYYLEKGWKVISKPEIIEQISQFGAVQYISVIETEKEIG